MYKTIGLATRWTLQYNNIIAILILLSSKEIFNTINNWDARWSILSQIRSTNFHSLTTRGHPLPTRTRALHYCYISPRTTVPIIHCTDNTHSWSHCLHSWFPSHTLLKPWTSSSSLPSISVYHSPSYFTEPSLSLAKPVFLCFDSCFVFLDCLLIVMGKCSLIKYWGFPLTVSGKDSKLCECQK